VAILDAPSCYRDFAGGSGRAREACRSGASSGPSTIGGLGLRYFENLDVRTIPHGWLLGKNREGPQSRAISRLQLQAWPGPAHRAKLTELSYKGTRRTSPRSSRATATSAPRQSTRGRTANVDRRRPDRSGAVTVNEASCRARPALDVAVDATLGSEVGQPALAIEGRYRS